MQKALARNPNLLRTLLGLSVTLIIVLGYSIYSASIESEYYLYSTEMDEVIIESSLQNYSDDKSVVWSGFSDGHLSWVNVTIEGAPSDSTLTITSGGSKWWSHELLGDENAQNFNCLEPNSKFEMINTCDFEFTHSVFVDEGGNLSIRGLLSDELPLSGLGTIRADNLTQAEQEADLILERAKKNVTWRIELTSDNSIESNTLTLHATVVDNSLSGVEKFKLNPLVESIWSLTALISCFVMVLALPLGIYYASIKRERRIELLRNENDESE
ncbi:MAG: hypothetical protein CMA77_01405 [Euryarchaeota archaeon]|nr:hypothetical protein [Euryarchaeota archaeon]